MCTMDARGLKCVKCIRDKQGCFWGHVSIAGHVKKGFEGNKDGMADSDEDDDDDEEEVEAVKAPWMPKRRLTRFPVAGRLVHFQLILVAAKWCIGPSKNVGRKLLQPRATSLSTSIGEPSRKVEKGKRKSKHGVDYKLEVLEDEKLRGGTRGAF